MYTETQEKKLLLKQFQPPTFKEEGSEVEKLAETWIEQLDDYFNEAGTALVNCAMFGMFKLAGEAKLCGGNNTIKIRALFLVHRLGNRLSKL